MRLKARGAKATGLFWAARRLGCVVLNCCAIRRVAEFQQNNFEEMTWVACGRCLIRRDAAGPPCASGWPK